MMKRSSAAFASSTTSCTSPVTLSRPSTRFWKALLSFLGRARSMAIAIKVSVRPSSVVHTRSSQPEQYR
ncbi:hypothetical protein D3C85_1596120 [compost metagenome]